MFHQAIDDASLAGLEAKFAAGEELDGTDAYYMVVGQLERGRSNDAEKAAEALLAKGNTSGAVAFAEDDATSEATTIVWLRRAADAGDGEAAYLLGNIYYHTEDFKSAKEMYEMGADLKFHEATVALGFLYEEGKGVPQDNLEAARAFMRIMDCGDGPWSIIDIPEESWPVDGEKGWQDFEKLGLYMEGLDDKQRHLLLEITRASPTQVTMSDDQIFREIMRLADDPRISDKELRERVRKLAPYRK